VVAGTHLVGGEGGLEVQHAFLAHQATGASGKLLHMWLMSQDALFSMHALKASKVKRWPAWLTMMCVTALHRSGYTVPLY
jgi:hypothetical protein